MVNSEKDTEKREAIPTKPMSDMDKLMVERHKLRESKNAERERAKATPAQPTAIRSAEYDRVAQAATEGDPVAQEVMVGIATALGADNPAYSNGRLSYKDANGNVVTPNWEEWRDQGTKVLDISQRLFNFSPGKTQQSETQKAQEGAKTQEQPAEKAQEQTQSQTTTQKTEGRPQVRREAIPSEYDRYRQTIDSIYYKGLPSLTRGEMFDAAMSGNAGNLKTLSDIDISRSSAPLERDYIRARTEAARARAVGGMGGYAAPEVKYERMDNGAYLITEKESGRPLYAIDPKGAPMPAEFAYDLPAWTAYAESRIKQLGLKEGERFGIHPRFGEVVSRIDANGRPQIKPVSEYLASRATEKTPEAISTEPKAQKPTGTHRNLGTLEHDY